MYCSALQNDRFKKLLMIQYVKHEQLFTQKKQKL
jgi:hypothetical protein